MLPADERPAQLPSIKDAGVSRFSVHLQQVFEPEGNAEVCGSSLTPCRIVGDDWVVWIGEPRMVLCTTTTERSDCVALDVDVPPCLCRPQSVSVGGTHFLLPLSFRKWLASERASMLEDEIGNRGERRTDHHSVLD